MIGPRTKRQTRGDTCDGLDEGTSSSYYSTTPSQGLTNKRGYSVRRTLTINSGASKCDLFELPRSTFALQHTEKEN